MEAKIQNIMLNGAKFSNKMAQNKELLQRLLTPKKLKFKNEDLKACAKIFQALQEVNKKAQLSQE